MTITLLIGALERVRNELEHINQCIALQEGAGVKVNYQTRKHERRSRLKWKLEYKIGVRLGYKPEREICMFCGQPKFTHKWFGCLCTHQP